MDKILYKKKLAGAIIGRFAGCALGAPVELMSLQDLFQFATSLQDNNFPPTHYFLKAPHPDEKRYLIGKGRDFTQTEMSFLSTDDDIAYTLLALMMLEEHRGQLTTSNVATYWLRYLPLECTYTAERTTLQNLRDGIAPEFAALRNNDELEFIGAAIRIDAYGYINPGNPKQASELAYQDAYLSHREAGIYSACYFAALIALAFTTTDIDQAMEEAIDYIPKGSRFYGEISWALKMRETVTDYNIANEMVTSRYPNMSVVHAINNACLCIWGIHIGRNNYEKGISETVAMAYDNDCTAATVGSVLGAYLGIDHISKKWYEPWNNRILSYLKGIPEFKLDDVIERFYILGLEHLH